MKISLTFLAVGLAALVAAAGPALSADWNNGAGPSKGYGSSAVPVPAPIAIPDGKTNWYLRADAGFGFGKTGSITSTGEDVGFMKSFSDQSPNGVYRFGAGRYITPTLRAEVAFSFRNQQKITKGTTTKYKTTTKTAGEDLNVVDVINGTEVLLVAPTQITQSTSNERFENATTGNQDIMFNLYQDLSGFGAFKPYIGGGVGVVVRNTKRNFSQEARCDGAVRSYNDPFSGAIVNTPLAFCPGGNATTSSSGGYNDTGYGFALAAATGFGYQISSGITLDLGYRYLYSSTPTSITAWSGNDTSKLKFDWRGEHELSTGLRFDLD